jgi:hypothetical protein
MVTLSPHKNLLPYPQGEDELTLKPISYHLSPPTFPPGFETLSYTHEGTLDSFQEGGVKVQLKNGEILGAMQWGQREEL